MRKNVVLACMLVMFIGGIKTRRSENLTLNLAAYHVPLVGLVAS